MIEHTEQMSRFVQNYGRVQSLLRIYDKAKSNSSEGAEVIKNDEDIRLTDLLRAAVVFLHGSQEDYIRSILSEWMRQKVDEKELSTIALLGSSGRVEKFSLAQLNRFSKYSVSTLIDESIKESLGKTSFNSYTEICSWMNKIGISLATFSNQNQINELIKRRHKIVHEVDQVAYGNKGGMRVSHIETKTVRSWCSAVREMLELIDRQVVEWARTGGDDHSNE